VVLDTTTLPDTIKVVTQEDVQGSFRDARSIGNNIHLVTSSYINFYLLAESAVSLQPRVSRLERHRHTRPLPPRLPNP
jgi:hypothetical protein